MKKPVIASLLLLILVLSACSSFPQTTPTALPTLAFIVTPTFALTNAMPPSTETPESVSVNGPQGQLASEWNGIPIMPEAIAGEGDEESYVFTVKATPQQVQEYYQLELGKLDWQLLAAEEGDASMKFMNNASQTLTIKLIAKGDQVLVLLVK